MPTLWEAIKANTKTLGGAGVMQGAKDKGMSDAQAKAEVERVANTKLNYGKPAGGQDIKPASYKR